MYTFVCAFCISVYVTVHICMRTCAYLRICVFICVYLHAQQSSEIRAVVILHVLSSTILQLLHVHQPIIHVLTQYRENHRNAILLSHICLSSCPFLLELGNWTNERSEQKVKRSLITGTRLCNVQCKQAHKQTSKQINIQTNKLCSKVFCLY